MESKESQHCVIEELLNDKIPLPDSPHPQETGIIRAMETGNTSPTLSFSPSPLYSLLSLFLSLCPSVCLFLPPDPSPSPRYAFICTDYQVQRLKAYNESCDGYQHALHPWVYWK